MPLVDHPLAELGGQKGDAGLFDELQQHPARHRPVRARADHQHRRLRRLERLHRLAHRFDVGRSEEHTSELQSLMRISYAVFCLKKKKQHNTTPTESTTHTTNSITTPTTK